MAKRKTLDQFLIDAKAIFGGLYGYDLVEYQNNKTPVAIRCFIHGIFYQKPNDHLCGKGCPICAKEILKKVLYGVGINDVINANHSAAYQIWHNILMRCYDAKFLIKHPSYRGCTVNESWFLFSAFKSWFENPINGYQPGYHLDKDILVKGNKEYSPNKCCFVPKDINALFTNRKSLRGNTPIGICKRGGGYEVYVDTNGERTRYIGTYSKMEDAFNAYKVAKEYRIREIAFRSFLEGRINSKVYEAMLNYKISIDD